MAVEPEALEAENERTAKALKDAWIGVQVKIVCLRALFGAADELERRLI